MVVDQPTRVARDRAGPIRRASRHLVVRRRNRPPSTNGGETFAARDFDLDATGAGEIVELDGVHLEVARRGDGYLIRVHDENAPTVRDFRGVPTYEPDPSWALSATFEPYSTPRPVTVGAVAEGLAHVYVSPGELVLTRDGADHRLIAFNGKAGGLSVLFTDGTSGVTTYAANRSVAIEADDEVVRSGGEVIIDFNRATNLPCAFIDFATCPLPPAGNTLPFDVTAGEKIPTSERDTCADSSATQPSQPTPWILSRRW